MNEKIFTPDVKRKADAILERYENKRATTLEILRLMQEHHGHITIEIEEAVANYLEIPPIDVHEVVTFYTLFYRDEKAHTRFNVCHTLSCSLMGCDDMVKHLEQKLGIKAGEKTADGKFSIQRVECLGACEIAPMLQLNDDEYVGDLTKEKLNDLIEKAKA